MCAPVEEIGEEARRATPMYVPRRPSDAEPRPHEIHHMPYRSWCEYCLRGRGKESPHLSLYEQVDGGFPVVQMDCAFLHDTGDKEAKVTLDNSSGQAHDKFVEQRDRSMWQNTWQLKEKRQPSSDRPPRKAANQSRTLSEHTNQSVEAMVRIMKEVMEVKAHTPV